MTSIRACQLPEAALLRKYQSNGYTDCYFVDVAKQVSQAAFIEAFYTTSLFKIERAVLRWFAAKPSTDQDAKALAAGAATAFAAWKVEQQSDSQLLLADFTGRTRSWLMATAMDAPPDAACTRLYFGSAVVAQVNRVSGKGSMGIAFSSLLGLHRLYSRLLLGAAKSRLMRD